MNKKDFSKGLSTPVILDQCGKLSLLVFIAVILPLKLQMSRKKHFNNIYQMADNLTTSQQAKRRADEIQTQNL